MFHFLSMCELQGKQERSWMSQQHTVEQSLVKAGLQWMSGSLGLMRTYFLHDLRQMTEPVWPSDHSRVWMSPQKLTLEFNCHCNGINRWGLQEWLGHEGSTPYHNWAFLMKGYSQQDPLGLSVHLPFRLPSRDEDELPHLALDLPTSRTVTQTISIIYYLPICLEFCRAVKSGPRQSASYKVGQGWGAHVNTFNTFSTVNGTAVSFTRWYRPCPKASSRDISGASFISCYRISKCFILRTQKNSLNNLRTQIIVLSETKINTLFFNLKKSYCYSW